MSVKNVNVRRGGSLPEIEGDTTVVDPSTLTSILTLTDTGTLKEQHREGEETTSNAGDDLEINVENTNEDNRQDRSDRDREERDHRLLDQPLERLSVHPSGQDPWRPSTSGINRGINERDRELSYYRCDPERLTLKEARNLIPPFEGKSQGDLREFISACDYAFQHVDLRLKGNLLEAVLGVKLKGKALQATQYKEIGTYEQLKETLKKLYGERRSLFSLQNEFNQLRQRIGESVQSFGNRVENTLMELIEATVREERSEVSRRTLQSFLRKQALELFREGLKEEIRIIVKARNIDTLEVAIREAMEEERIRDQHRPSKAYVRTPEKDRYYSRPRERKRCRHCGKDNHEEKDCRYKNRDVRKPGTGNQEATSRLRCYICNLPGHYARDCRKRYREPDKETHKKDESSKNVRVIEDDLNDQAPECGPATVQNI